MNFLFLAVIFVYNALFLVLFPAIVALFGFRFWKKKESGLSLMQKFVFGYAFKDVQNFDVWIHGASVGEVKSGQFLVEEYVKIGKSVLFTSGTLTSKKVVQGGVNVGVNVFHRFLPLDFLPFLLFFIYKHRVKKVIILESEIWPSLFFALQALKFNVTLLNVDVSKKSQKRWKVCGLLLRQILKTARVILTQNESTMRFLGGYHENVNYFGNVKLLNLNENFVPKNADIINFCTQENLITKKPILTVASTHEGEDEKIIQAIAKLGGDYKIIYVPRHPERCESVGRMLNDYGIKHARLSKFSELDCTEFDCAELNCILVDSIGNLMDALFFTSIAIYGGSFCVHLAGHNVLEAGIFKCRVVTGNYVEAFEEIIAELKNVGGIIQTDSSLIYEAILNAKQSGQMGQNEQMGQKIYDYILQNKPNLEKIWEAIN